MLIRYIVPFIIALVAAYLLTPAVKTLALRVGAVDRPNARKVHTQYCTAIGRVGDLYRVYGGSIDLSAFTA